MADIQIQTDVEQAKAAIDNMETNEENSLIQKNEDQPEPKTIRPVKGKPKKKSFGEKFKEAMFGEDIGEGSIAEHIFFRIFIPSFKRILADMGNSAINMALGLDPKTRTIRAGESHAANASVYRDRGMNRAGGYGRRGSWTEYEWSEEDAKDIYDQIDDLIEHYNHATVSDVYSIMGMPTKIRSTDRDWGWTSIRNIDVYPIDALKERWVVDLPPAKPL